MAVFNIENLEEIPMYNIYIGYIKHGLDSGYGNAYAKGLIYECNGLTPVFFYDKDNSILYVAAKEFIQKTITIH